MHTIVSPTTFALERKFKAVFAAIRSNPGRIVSSCRAVECELKDSDLTSLCFCSARPVHAAQRLSLSRSLTLSLSQARPITLRGRMKKYSTFECPEKCAYVLSSAASAKSSRRSNRCRQGAGQCSSRDNGETSCWCFQQANASLPGLSGSRHLVSGASFAQTWLCLYRGSLEMMHSIFPQIPDATTRASNPSCSSVWCFYRAVYHLLFERPSYWSRLHLSAARWPF